MYVLDTVTCVTSAVLYATPLLLQASFLFCFLTIFVPVVLSCVLLLYVASCLCKVVVACMYFSARYM
jgi:hypothetical protein